MAHSDRFVNRRILATGGMATIYRAEDLKLGVDVAIKEILIQPTLSERARNQMESRLRREAKTLARLDHPNIVRCFGIIEDEGAPFIITEFLDGVTLEQEIMSRRIVGDRLRILDVFRQVCAGLEYARSRDVVHRDVKPGNIFLCSSGIVKIIDFGIARQEDGMGITVDGQILGTPHFMSPEQAEGARNIDYRSDVFSLGSCIFLAASGTLPFDAPNHFAVENAVRFDAMPRGRVWPELEPVLLRALAKKPQDRYQSFAHLADDLWTALDPGSKPRAAAVQPPQAAAPVREADSAPVHVPETTAPRVTPREMPRNPDSTPRPVSDARPVRPPQGIAQSPTPWPHGTPAALASDRRAHQVSSASPGDGSATTADVVPWLIGAGMCIGIILIASEQYALGTAAIFGSGLALAVRAGSSVAQGTGSAAAPRPGGASSAPQANRAADREHPVAFSAPLRPAKRLRLTINGTPGESRASDDETFELGRDGACHICVPNDTLVSSRHATIVLLPQGGFRITDHSSNGTHANGRRVASADLPYGTRLRVGATEIVVDAVFGG